MSLEISEKEKRIQLANTKGIFEILQSMLLLEDEPYADKEHFWMVGLDKGNSLQYIELISHESYDDEEDRKEHPMDVFRWAVMKDSAKIIMVHNHPDGDLSVKQEELDITDRFIQVGIILNVPVTDHLIITKDEYMSFAEAGIMDKLTKSTRWIPKSEQEQSLLDEKKQIREEAIKQAMQTGKEEGLKEGKHEQAIDIAKGMIAEGVETNLIMKVTGLSKKVIEGLK